MKTGADYISVNGDDVEDDEGPGDEEDEGATSNLAQVDDRWTSLTSFPEAASSSGTVRRVSSSFFQSPLIINSIIIRPKVLIKSGKP